METEVYQLGLPGQPWLLEEINLPADLAKWLAGQWVTVQVLPEEPLATRQVEPNDVPLWIDPQGNYWNDYRPVRLLYTDPEGQAWRLPRRWLDDYKPSAEGDADLSAYETERAVFTEAINLPSEWDLWEINIPWSVAHKAAGRETTVEIHLSPKEPAKVYWRDFAGKSWRIPHNWRRRCIRLPAYDVLTSQGIPSYVAEDFADSVVAVNYHPGSFCCVPDQYRFRDEDENRWPVRIRDCVFIAYGSTPEVFEEEEENLEDVDSDDDSYDEQEEMEKLRRELDSFAEETRQAEEPPQAANRHMLFCSGCGKPVESHWQVCPSCGRRQLGTIAKRRAVESSPSGTNREALSWLGVGGLSVAVFSSWLYLIGEVDSKLDWWQGYFGIPAAFVAGLVGRSRTDIWGRHEDFFGWLAWGALFLFAAFSWIVISLSIENAKGFRGFAVYFSIPAALFLGFWMAHLHVQSRSKQE